MTNGDIIDKVREYVLELLSGKLPNGMRFHTVMHTQEVVKLRLKLQEKVTFPLSN